MTNTDLVGAAYLRAARHILRAGECLREYPMTQTMLDDAICLAESHDELLETAKGLIYEMLPFENNARSMRLITEIGQAEAGQDTKDATR